MLQTLIYKISFLQTPKTMDTKYKCITLYLLCFIISNNLYGQVRLLTPYNVKNNARKEIYPPVFYYPTLNNQLAIHHTTIGHAFDISINDTTFRLEENDVVLYPISKINDSTLLKISYVEQSYEEAIKTITSMRENSENLIDSLRNTENENLDYEKIFENFLKRKRNIPTVGDEKLVTQLEADGSLTETVEKVDLGDVFDAEVKSTLFDIFAFSIISAYKNTTPSTSKRTREEEIADFNFRLDNLKKESEWLLASSKGNITPLSHLFDPQIIYPHVKYNGPQIGFGHSEEKKLGKVKPISFWVKRRLNKTPFYCSNLVIFNKDIYLSALNSFDDTYELTKVYYHRSALGVPSLYEQAIEFPKINGIGDNFLVDIKNILIDNDQQISIVGDNFVSPDSTSVLYDLVYTIKRNKLNQEIYDHHKDLKYYHGPDTLVRHQVIDSKILRGNQIYLLNRYVLPSGFSKLIVRKNGINDKSELNLNKNVLLEDSVKLASISKNIAINDKDEVIIAFGKSNDNETAEAFLIMCDPELNVKWRKPIFEQEQDNISVSNLVLFKGNIFVFGKKSNSTEKDISHFITVFNQAGDKLNTINYKNTSFPKLEIFNQFMLKDNSFILVGEVFEEETKGDIFITKLDPNGKEVWFKTFGTLPGIQESYFDSVVDSEGNIFVGGRSSSNFFLTQFNSDGNYLYKHFLPAPLNKLNPGYERFYPPIKLALDGDNSVYMSYVGLDYNDGTYYTEIWNYRKR